MKQRQQVGQYNTQTITLKTKSSKSGKTPKDPPRRAKRKEIDGQTILTSELLTMEIQKKRKEKQHKLNPQKIKDKQKEKEEEKKRIRRYIAIR